MTNYQCQLVDHANAAKNCRYATANQPQILGLIHLKPTGTIIPCQQLLIKT